MTNETNSGQPAGGDQSDDKRTTLESASIPNLAAVVMLAIQRVTKPPLFSLGQVVATTGALDLLDRSGVNASVLLTRHQRGDWGNLCEEDIQSNNEALKNHTRSMSSYELGADKERMWIITEYDHSVTTLLLPAEY